MMKIKLDYITNSSSTSFVYISDKELNKEDFMKAVGVDIDGPVSDLFLQMYEEICSALRRKGNRIISKEAVDSLVGSHEFTPETICRMKDAIDRGKTVITSTLSSEGSLAESLMCMTVFEIESDQFYINAYCSYW